MSFYRWVRWLTRRPPWKPLSFPASGFDVFDESAVLEEESFAAYRQGDYYPMTLGDVLADRYQVVGKLGFGRSSTVWLARDHQAHKHAALKVYTRGEDHSGELEVYQTIRRANRNHPGNDYVRSMLGTLTLPRDGGDHICLVQEPLWDSLDDLRHRRDPPRFTEDLLKPTLVQIFQALDFLHTDCRLVHTDIKGGNILLAIKDEDILHQFVKDELKHPCPRKILPDTTVYASRPFDVPKDFGQVVLSDLGEAVNGDERRHHNAQPNIHRSPEVMLQADWSYPADIWNVGTMASLAQSTIWDLFEDSHLFFGHDPDGRSYTTRAHLAEVIGMLGSPPGDLLRSGRRTSEFFDEAGRFVADVPIPENSLEDRETCLSGENKQAFLTFIRRMLQWRPENRATAKELLQDPWLHTSSPQ